MACFHFLTHHLQLELSRSQFCRDFSHSTMLTPPKRRRHRLSATRTDLPPPPPPPTTITTMDVEEKEDDDDDCYYLPIPNPALWLINLIYNCLVTLLLSPLFSLFSLLSESFLQAEEDKDTVESAVHAAARVPCKVAYGTGVLLRKIGLGFLGALHACMVLTMVMALAIVLGVGLVQLWVEDPVVLRERLHFDYTQVHPNAVFSLGRGGGGGGGGAEGWHNKKKMKGVPVGHTFYVSLALLLPESDYNREVGVFQLNAELISTNGNAIAKSSQPCMLRFRSLPIRLARTFLMGIPLLLGITDETQKITIPMLKHKEGYPRTKSIIISLIPRARTSFIPQIYEAEIILNSQLPWRKEIVRRWKWTLCVWTSLYIYIILVIVLVCCFRQLILPMTRSSSELSEQDSALEVSKEPEERTREGGDVSESFRRWQRRRSKRKAMLLHRVLPDTSGSSASSIVITREETIATTEEDAGDSESVCFGG